MIWGRRRAESGQLPRPTAEDAFVELLDDAPVMALLLDAESGAVLKINRAARHFFDLESSRLPASLVEATLESRLLDFVNSGEASAEVELVHHRRTVDARLVTWPRHDQEILFLDDVSDLRRLTTVRREFVSNLVHELKTPITSLRLTAESLLTDPAPKDRRRFAERIVREADLISKIIDNLRRLGDIEAGAIAIEITHVDVAELVDETIARLGLDRPVNRSIADGIDLDTDRAKLAQALANLLDNAAKFSPPGTAIDIAAGDSAGEVVISVRDRGPGISPEHWSRVFERFYKVDRARPREAGGFGLGLAITKHLVQALGGRVWTEAAREGGQVFSIALPRQDLTSP